MNLFILLGIVGMALGGPSSPGPASLFSFVLFGFVDELFGDAGAKEDMPPVWYMQLMLYLTLPLLILATLVTFNVVSPTGWPWLDAAVPRLRHRSGRGPRQHRQRSGGAVRPGRLGQPRHVLRRRRRERRARADPPHGQALRPRCSAAGCSPSPGTPALPSSTSTATTAMSAPSSTRPRRRAAPTSCTFVFTSTIGQWLSAKRYEDDRLKRKGIPNTPWTNRFWRGQLMTLVVIALLRRLPRADGHPLVRLCRLHRQDLSRGGQLHRALRPGAHARHPRRGPPFLGQPPPRLDRPVLQPHAPLQPPRHRHAALLGARAIDRRRRPSPCPTATWR